MSASSATATGTGLRRDAGIIGLLFASTTSMIGSGWLFGALHASKIAGPLSLVKLDPRRRHHHADRTLLCGARLAVSPRRRARSHEPREPRRRPGAGLGLDAVSLLCRGALRRSGKHRDIRQQPLPPSRRRRGRLDGDRLRRLRSLGRHPGAGQSSRHSLASGRQQHGDLVEDRGAAPDGNRSHRRRRSSDGAALDGRRKRVDRGVKQLRSQRRLHRASGRGDRVQLSRLSNRHRPRRGKRQSRPQHSAGGDRRRPAFGGRLHPPATRLPERPEAAGCRQRLGASQASPV